MRKEPTWHELAPEIAAPYLGKPDTQRVFVNDKGLVWVNNDEAHMAEYFAGRKESYRVFHKSSPSEAPEIEEQEKKKPGRKAKS